MVTLTQCLPQCLQKITRFQEVTPILITIDTLNEEKSLLTRQPTPHPPLEPLCSHCFLFLHAVRNALEKFE